MPHAQTTADVLSDAHRAQTQLAEGRGRSWAIGRQGALA
jgi:hypothetical protein